MADPLTIAFIAGTAIKTVVGMASQLQQGKEAERYGRDVQTMKNNEAAQLTQEAGQVVARSQRAGIEERRKGRIISSRNLAVASAGGGNPSDPTVIDIIAGVDAEAKYRSDLQIAEGKDRSNGLLFGADMKRYEGEMAYQQGKKAKKQSKMAAVMTLVEGVASGAMGYKVFGGSPGSGMTSASMYSKYGGTTGDFSVGGSTWSS